MTLAVQELEPVPSLPGLSRASSLDEVDARVLSRLLAGDVIDLVAD
jgi:hypothetical protein